MSLASAWRIAVICCTVAVLVAAGYVLFHHDPVPRAGGQTSRIPNPSTPGAAASHSSPSGSSSTATGPELTAAFIGDDWTAGVGASSPADRFTTRVCAALHLHEVNVGVNQAGYAESSEHSGYQAQVAPAVRAHPDLVVVSGGRNDSVDLPATDAAAASTLFHTLRAKLPHAVIVAVAPMWGNSPMPPMMKRLGRFVRRAVTAVHGTYLAVPDPIEGHPNEMADDADPNDAGYAAIARALTPALRPLLP